MSLQNKSSPSLSSKPSLRTGAKEEATRVVKNKPKAVRNYGTCVIQQATVPDYPIESTFTASYPVSKNTYKESLNLNKREVMQSKENLISFPKFLFIGIWS